MTSRTTRWRPTYVIVDTTVAGHDTTQSILAQCGNAEIHITDVQEGESDAALLARILKTSNTASQASLTSLSRRSLLLWDSPALVQPMATGPAWERRCFNFMKVMPYIGTCTFNCSYCWFKDPVLIPRVNVRFFERLPALLDDFRAGGRAPIVFTFTHYKTDCFGLEHLTGFCRRAADFFEQQPDFYLQFLTKSSWVDSLLEAPVPKRSLVSFSINPAELVDSVDLGTASLEDRIAAASRLSNAGIDVAFRVDPMMAFDGWPGAYRRLADAIFDGLDPTQITLGTPRFQTMDEARNILETTRSPRARAFMSREIQNMSAAKPGTTLVSDSDDAYFKSMSVSYDRALRVSLYRNMLEGIRNRNEATSVGLCEEPADVWDEVGLAWSGDRTKDCSCNFIAPGNRGTLSSANIGNLTKQQAASIEADRACRTGVSHATGPVDIAIRQTRPE